MCSSDLISNRPPYHENDKASKHMGYDMEGLQNAGATAEVSTSPRNPESPKSGITKMDQDKVQTAKACHPKATKIPEIIIQEPDIEVYRYYMK